MSMKQIIFLLFLLFAVTGMAQTKLINHKSHSGTNETFNTSISQGNFGLPDFSMTEIQENSSSRYKLLLQSFTSGERTKIYILFDEGNTENPTTNTINYAGTVGEVLVKIELIAKDSKEIKEQVEEMLIKKLTELRSKEKK